MTTKAAPKPVTTNVVELQVRTKVEKAAAFFAEIHSPSFVVPEGSSPRKEFIDRCIGELQMTENGASTYWQNERNKAAGKLPQSKATGLPRGRKPNPEGRVNKAAARVKKLRGDVNAKMKALQEAEDDLVLIAGGTVAG